MAYSNNPNLPSAKAMVMKLLLLEQQPLLVVVRKSGFNRTTDLVLKASFFGQAYRPNFATCMFSKGDLRR